MSLRRAAPILALGALGALGALAACGDAGGFSGDPFPVYLDRAAGAFVVTIRVGDGAPETAVLDLLSPITILDAPLGEAPRRRRVELALLGHRSPTDPELITRARFSPSAIFLHPCDGEAPCTVGAPGAPRPITAVIGADTLRGDAIRFHPSEDRISVLPDIAGDSEARARTCDAELPSPFYGGGTLVLGGTELGFSGLRIALNVCLSPDPLQADPAARGIDSAMVLSSGIGPSIIGAARYTAYATETGATPLESLPPASVLLPSGVVEGRLARIAGIAIAATATSESPRGACREVYAQHLLSGRDCVEGDDCPCTEGTFCGAPAVIELATSIEAIVVPDTHPLLQALRAELRPSQPEIDGILGMSALVSTELDVDYPGNRLLFRCAGAGCTVRPKLGDRAGRAVIARCLLGAIPAIDARAVGINSDARPVP